jgi:hypothetical protein
VLYNGWFLRKLFHYLRKNDKLTIEVSINLAIDHLMHCIFWDVVKYQIFVLLPIVFSLFIKLIIVLILQAIVLKFVFFFFACYGVMYGLASQIQDLCIYWNSMCSSHVHIALIIWMQFDMCLWMLARAPTERKKVAQVALSWCVLIWLVFSL